MKKRIYKIKGKNLVVGDPNELSENELLVKENNDGTVELSHRNNGTLETLGNGGSGGSEPEYVDLGVLSKGTTKEIGVATTWEIPINEEQFSVVKDADVNVKFSTILPFNQGLGEVTVKMSFLNKNDAFISYVGSIEFGLIPVPLSAAITENVILLSMLTF